MSAHNLTDDPSTPFVKLWPRPSKFVTNGTECAVYMNGFGPEGGFHLGSYEDIYHPMCLISFMVVRRCCALYKAPFHKHLNELFGLVPYMPSNWECNPDNIPGLRHLWDDDLVWSWQLHDHSHNKSNISSQFRWENDPTKVVTVCQRLVGFGNHNKGKRNFFYQCFGGYWNERNKIFQFEQHPDGFIWNEIEERIHHGVGIMVDYICTNLSLSTSEWIEHFREEAVDSLLERHSPETLRTFQWLKDSEFLKTILEVDRPTRWTWLQLRRRLVLGDGKENPPDMLVGCNNNKAGPSGTANDIM